MWIPAHRIHAVNPQKRTCLRSARANVRPTIAIFPLSQYQNGFAERSPLTRRRMRLAGSVAKSGWGRKKPGLDFSLGGNPDEALHKSHLSLNVTFAYSFNLPFSHHMHRLITLDGSTCRLKTEEPQSGINSSFDEPMVVGTENVIRELYARASPTR
jgi:hypothetical protein